MRTYYDSAGRKINLTAELGTGGEGSVYAVESDGNLVGKIYHQPISDEKAEKLRWMAANKNNQLLKVAAWVTEVLHNRTGGEVVGFLMSTVKAKEVHELYSPKDRRKHFPDADWRFLIHAATNLARAFNNVHEQGHVIGDVNHGNCVVQFDGTVKLIDCDSYSIHANGKIYPCEVGVATHIAPELQGQSLRGIVRSQQHDNFGLAVIIFQLLFLGRHPYSGKLLDSNESSLEKNIREYRFAYGAGAASRKIKQPPGTLDLQAVSQPVAQLFERAFLTNNRSTPQDWIKALKDLSENLSRCRQNSGHHYLKTLSACPWCELERQTGLPLFPIDYSQQGQTGGFSIVTIEQLLNSIQMPQNLPAKPQQLSILPAPDPALIKQNKRSGLMTAGFIVVEIALLTVLIIYAGLVGALICGFALSFIFYRLSDKTEPEVKKEIIDKLNESRKNWHFLENEWNKKQSNESLIVQTKEIKEKIEKYKNLPQLRLIKLKELDEQVYERQLENYLDSFRIDKANIKGIGWNRAITLQSYGIETAADIDRYKILSIPGFGPTFTQNLLIWRDTLKVRFRFNPNKGVSPQDKQKVEMQIVSMRMQFENLLQNQVSVLRSKAANINGINQNLAAKAKDLSEALAQAQSNKNAVRDFSLQTGVLVTLALGIPLGGLFVNFVRSIPRDVANSKTTEISTPSNVSVTSNNSLNSINTNITVTNSNNANFNANSNQSVPEIPELVDIDIAALTETERQDKAEELFNKGVEYTKSNNYSKAVKYYQVAVKFDNAQANYYHELGYALYRIKRYQESVIALQKSASLGSTNNDTQKILGLNYIELKKWGEAQKVFTEITRSDYYSFPAFYNLGISAKNAGDLTVAEDSLKRAITLKPNEAKAHFELGRCYIKLGQMSDADSEYQTLLLLNPQLADQLKQETGSQ